MNYQVIKEKIRNHSLRNKDSECCGFITDKEEIVEIENISSNKKNHFLTGMTLKQATEKYGNIKAFYHSHLPGNNEFSLTDKIVSEYTNIISLLYCMGTDDLKIYKPDGMPIPYQGRPFQPYLFDCFELVRDYYQKELNLEISELISEERGHSLSDWQNLGYNRVDNIGLIKHFLNNNFIEVNKKNWQKHDVFLCRSLGIKMPCHCIIYLDNNKILHQPNTEPSLIEDLNNFWSARIVNVIRHKTLL
jgi:proteasome lid subunit RPN8/RPN11